MVMTSQQQHTSSTTITNIHQDVELQNSSCLISPPKSACTSQEEAFIEPTAASHTLSSFRLQSLLRTSLPPRASPLPSFNWADSRDVWRVMVRKEERYVRKADMMSRHPVLQSRMRTILLEWLIEVRLAAQTGKIRK